MRKILVGTSTNPCILTLLLTLLAVFTIEPRSTTAHVLSITSRDALALMLTMVSFTWIRRIIRLFHHCVHFVLLLLSIFLVRIHQSAAWGHLELGGGVAKVDLFVVYPHLLHATFTKNVLFFIVLTNYKRLPFKLVKFLRCQSVKACCPGSGGTPPRYIGVVSLRKSFDPSLMIERASPLSTLSVKFFLMAMSSAIWYCPSDTISKLQTILLFYLETAKSLIVLTYTLSKQDNFQHRN